MRGRAGAGLLLVSLTLSCSSTSTLQPIAATTPEESWRELQSLSRNAGTVESYSKLTLSSPRRQTINARTAVDRQGRFRAELLTPLGTTAATLFADGNNVLFLNDLEQTYWRGTHAELADRSPRVAPLFAIGQQTSRLIYGLPPVTDRVSECAAASSEQSCFESDRGRFVVERGGLRSASMSGATFEYEPPALPANRVSVSLRGQSITIEHLDVQMRSGAVKMPAVPAGYRCCSVPSLEVKE